MSARFSLRPSSPASGWIGFKLRRSCRGFTLVEMIVVIAITGIVAAMVAVFVRAPVLGYVDSARRAELTDEAGTAFRRISRDLRLAVPNSVRVTGGNLAVEFLLARSGGRYRAGCSDAATGDPLAFGDPAAYPCETALSANSFDVLGPGVQVEATDSIVVYNLGIAGADAYAGDTLRPVNGTSGPNVSSIAFSGTQFPLPSPSNRFQVVEGPVSYVCEAGTLRRYWNYAVGAARTTGSSALLASNVTGCQFTYDPLVVANRAGLVTLRLTLAREGESVNLYEAVHVSNVP